MGTGANIQSRAVAEHHIDPPWRPADIEQREGRILRQGNQNTAHGPVAIHTYITEQTFDAYSWQIVTHKARTIAQVRAGGSARHVDVDDSDTLSFEAQAIAASGDPRMQQRYQAQQDLTRLQHLERAHHAEQRQLTMAVNRAERQLARLTEILPRLEQVVASIRPTAGDQFAATIDGTTTNRRADVGRALFHLVGQHNPRPGQVTDVHRQIGTMAGLDLWMQAESGAYPKIAFWFPDLDAQIIDGPTGRAAAVDLKDMDSPHSPGAGVVTRIEHYLAGVPAEIRGLKDDLDRLPQRITDTLALIGADFPHTEEITELRGVIRRLDAELAEQDAAHAPSVAGARTPAWLNHIPPDDRGDLTHSARLQRLYRGGMTTVDHLRAGDIIPATATTGAPQRIETVTGWSTRTLTASDLATHTTSTVNKRPGTSTGILARPTANFTIGELAVLTMPTGAKVIPAAAVDTGQHVTISGARVGSNDSAVFTGTVTAVDDNGHPPTVTLRIDDTGAELRVRRQTDTIAILHPDHPEPANGDRPAARTDNQSPAGPAPNLPSAPDSTESGTHRRPPVTVTAANTAVRPTETGTTTAAEPLSGVAGSNANEDPDVDTVETKDATDEAIPPGVPDLRIEHGPSGTRLMGTSKQDTDLRAALKTGAWKWSRNQGYWYLPRTTGIDRRTTRVHALVTAMADHDRTLPVLPHPEDRQIPGAGAAVTPRAAALRSAPLTVLR